MSKPNPKPSHTARDWVGLAIFILIVLICIIPALAVAAGIAVLSWVFEEEVVRAKEKDRFNS
jgi:ABC-type Fe3+ transport system permease subunit